MAIFSIIVAVLFILIGNTYIETSYDGSLYDQKVTAKNLELLIQTSCLSTEGNLLIDHRLKEQDLTIDIRKENNSFIFEVEKKQNKFSFEVPEDFCTANLNELIGRPLNAYTLEIIKQGERIQLGNKEAFENFDFEDIEIDTLERVSLSWPVESRVVTSCYGERTCIGCSDDHKGVDIRASIGTEVRAMYPGKVKGITNGWGSVIIEQKVNNQALSIRYLHLSRINVNINDNIERGQIIGLSGDKVPIGEITPHLHIQTRINDKHFDPLIYFNTNSLEYKKDTNCNYNADQYAYVNDIKNNLIS